MKKILLLFFLCFRVAANPLAAQNCRAILNEAKAAHAGNNLKQALKKLQDTETCDYRNELLQERQALQNNIFKAIDDQRVEAENNAKKLLESTQKVVASEYQTQLALQTARVALDSVNILLTNLGKSNAECEVRLLLAEVERNQQELKFDVAVEKAKDAKTVGALSEAVEAGYKSLSRALLGRAREDLGRKEYNLALKKVNGAEELNVYPDSVAAVSSALKQFLFENIRQDILNTLYDDAAGKINALRFLQVPADTIESLRFEIAFCYTETGRLDRAAATLDTLAQMRGNNSLRSLFLELAGKEPAQQVQVLRQARQQLDPERNRILTDRYLTSVFRQIPAGTISIGDTRGACPVAVKTFLLAAKELTFFEYDLFCAATNRPRPPDNEWGRGLRPVINVDWYDAVEYCNWRSQKEGFQEVYTIVKNTGNADPGARNESVTCNWSANGYRLPTETEWEFAAGNGEQHSRYSWGNNPPAAQQGGNVSDETVKTKFPDSEIFAGYSDGFVYTAPTGSYPPNAFGLYDMTGNVSEWCWDWFDENYCRANKNRTAPQGPSTGTDKVLRGGYWLSPPKDCLAGNRFFGNPNTGKVSIGFRLARN